MADDILRVLIVHDDERDEVLVGDLLSRTAFTRFRCVGARGYREGVRLLAENGFDACLVAHRIGTRSGLDFLREPAVRTQGTPVLLLTQRDTSELDQEAMRAGAADCLPKDELTGPLLERALRHAVERHRRAKHAERIRFQAELLDAVGEAVIATDTDGRVTYWNQAAEKLLGRPAHEVMGSRVPELVTEEGYYRHESERVVSLLKQGETWSGEVRVRHKERGEFPARVTGSPLRDLEGDVIGTVGVITDLTGPVATEEQLRERVKELRALNQVSELMNQRQLPLGDRLDAVVSVLPSGLQWPQISAARLSVGRLTTASDGFRETEWMVTEEIPEGATEPGGRLDLVLLERPPDGVDDPFLPEERELMVNVARAVGQTVAREQVTRLLSQTFASLDEAVVVLDSLGSTRRIRYVNPAAERMFGFDPDELLGRTPEAVHPSSDSFRAFGAQASAVLAEGNTFRGTFTLRRRDGSHFEAEQTVSLLEPQLGPQGGVVTVVRDVTRRAAAEAALRESEERFRHLTEHINDVFWVTTADKTRVEYVSPAYGRVWGSPPETLYADPQSWLRAVHPDDRARIMEAQHQQTDGKYDVNYRVRRPDGSIRWIHDRAFPVHDDAGSLLRIVGVAEDITDRRMAEERFRVLGEETTDVVVVLAPDARILFASQSAEWLTGRTADDLVGSSALTLVQDEDRAKVQDLLDEVARDPDRNARAEFRMVRADGTVRDVESVARNLRHHPAVRGIVVTTRDVTERLVLERRLRQSQKMEAVGRLAGGIAHDFNNILTVIRSETELLLEQPDADMVEDLEVIRSAADRAATLTSQLLTFSREQVLRPRAVRLSSVVRELTPMVERAVGPGITLRLDLPQGDEKVLVDPDQLQQVILNLVVNATDAMPGGGTLSIGVGMERLGAEDLGNLPGLSPGRYAALSISDTGTGMSPEITGRIFDPFFTTKPTGKGTGLGLAMAYGFMKQTGGGIHVDTALGRGATFHLRFPLSRQPILQAAEAPEPGAEDVAERVLVVDDEEAIRDVTRRVLERAGYDVRVAPDVSSAGELLEHGPAFDLVLTDLVLPDGEGGWVAERARAVDPSTPVLVMTGLGPGPGDASGQGRRLAKPFTRDQLLAAVREALDRPRG